MDMDPVAEYDRSLQGLRGLRRCSRTRQPVTLHGERIDLGNGRRPSVRSCQRMSPERLALLRLCPVAWNSNFDRWDKA
jgi:hypothetical protein